MNYHILLFLCAVLLVCPASLTGQEPSPETAPAATNPDPSAAARPARPSETSELPVRIELLKSGYKVILDRSAADTLNTLMQSVQAEQPIADLLRDQGEKSTDDQTKADLKFIAAILQTQVPAFRKKLAANLGPAGVTITVVGIDNAAMEKRPVLRKLALAFLPPEMQQKAKKLIKVARTIPLTWSIQPRQDMPIKR